MTGSRSFNMNQTHANLIRAALRQGVTYETLANKFETNVRTLTQFLDEHPPMPTMPFKIQCTKCKTLTTVGMTSSQIRQLNQGEKDVEEILEGYSPEVHRLVRERLCVSCRPQDTGDGGGHSSGDGQTPDGLSGSPSVDTSNGA